MTAMVVTELTPGTVPLPPVAAKRGLRGAFMNLPFVGPARIAATTNHANGIETSANGTAGGGGTITTDGYRKSDNFTPGGEVEDVGLSTADGAGVNVVTRPARARWGQATKNAQVTVEAYTGDGIEGGSAPGAPFDTTGRAVSTGLDRFGRTKGVANSGAGLGTYDYTNASRKKGTVSGSAHALGGSGKTISTGTSQPDSIDGETIANDAKYVGGPRLAPGAGSTAATTIFPTLPAPTFGAISAGVIAVADGTNGALTVDLHDDDMSGGAQLRAGCVVAVYKPSTDDADEDGPLVKFASVDGTTLDTIATFTTGLAAATYTIYARFRAERPAKNGGGYVYGPVAKTTLAIA